MANDSEVVFVVLQNSEVKSVHSKALSAKIVVKLSPNDSHYAGFTVQDGPYPAGSKIFEVWCSLTRSSVKVFNNLKAAKKLASSNSDYTIFEHQVFTE